VRTRPLMVLGPGKIHLWLTFYDEIADESLLASYRELLTAEERAREQAFYFARDRRRYLVTRAMVRTVLSRYASIDPKAWLFSANRYGRPEVANVEYEARRLSFNISHTHSLIVLGVTERLSLGIDVENIMAREVSIDIADHFFSPNEVREIAMVPACHQQYRFFEYWTFKEAYIKARGMGLSLPLDKFGFYYPREDAVCLAIEPELGDNPSRWRFWQFRPRRQYLVAICAERVDAQSFNLAVRKIVPMVDEELLAVAFTRNSG
jgi:4'-phosphopantetheinyl transferase